jgi:hypothetical protein
LQKYDGKLKVLFLLIAVGENEERSKIAYETIRLIPKENNMVRYDCVIFSYARFEKQPSWLHESNCRIISMSGWNYPMFVKSVDPFFVDSLYDYVFICLDDIVWDKETYRLNELLSFTIRNNLDVSSSAIYGSYWKNMLPKTHKPGFVGRLVRHIEFFSTFLSLKAFRCFWELMVTTFDAVFVSFHFFS